jgi:hypothetical protein
MACPNARRSRINQQAWETFFRGNLTAAAA